MSKENPAVENRLKIKCTNEVCLEEYNIKEPRPDAVNSLYFSAVTFPSIKLVCKACGTITQLTLAQFKIEVEWQAVAIGKMPSTTPIIHRPS